LIESAADESHPVVEAFAARLRFGKDLRRQNRLLHTLQQHPPGRRADNAFYPEDFIAPGMEKGREPDRKDLPAHGRIDRNIDRGRKRLEKSSAEAPQRSEDDRLKDVRADVSGSGSIFLTATRSLDASVSGSGAILYTGSPQHVTKSVTGTGAITGS